MAETAYAPETFPHRWIPEEAEFKTWDQIEPWYRKLLDRPIGSPEDLEAWLLRGLVRCGACRIGVNTHKMVTPSGKVHRYYWCRNHINVRIGGPPRCSERNIRADALDAFVFEQVRTALLNPDLLVAGQAAVTRCF